MITRFKKGEDYKGKPLTGLYLASIKSLLRDNRKVMAIKMYHKYTGSPLKYAKEAVEEIESQMQG